MAKEYPRCPAPGCPLPGNYARGFCHQDYKTFLAHCVRKGSLTKAARDAELKRMQAEAQPSLPRWQWEGDEQSLIEMIEKQERVKAQEINQS